MALLLHPLLFFAHMFLIEENPPSYLDFSSFMISRRNNENVRTSHNSTNIITSQHTPCTRNTWVCYVHLQDILCTSFNARLHDNIQQESSLQKILLRSAKRIATRYYYVGHCTVVLRFDFLYRILIPNLINRNKSMNKYGNI